MIHSDEGLQSERQFNPFSSDNEEITIDQTKQTPELILKVKFSQVCSMKSMGSSWDSWTILLRVKNSFYYGVELICL